MRDDFFTSGAFIIIICLVLTLVIFMLICLWKIFEKAGREGWNALIPIYNSYVLYEISGKPGWWAFLAFIPYLGGIITIVLRIIASMELAKKFKQSEGFGIGIALLPFVFLPMLAFGNYTYEDSKLNQIEEYLQNEE